MTCSARYMSIAVLFVCLGNICRSPTAEGVFAHFVAARGLTDMIEVDSAGTCDFHPGKRPDPRSCRAAAKRGFDITNLRARVIESRDFERFDHILCMDEDNLSDLLLRCPDEHTHKVRMFVSWPRGTEDDVVPDPYLGTSADFELVLDVVEDAAMALLDRLELQP